MCSNCFWVMTVALHSNFDSSLQRVKYWTSDKYASGNSSPGNALTPASSSAHLVGLGISMAMSTAPNALADSLPTSAGIPNLSTGQRKRIKSYLKRCRLNPRHTQLNLEGYLLLPVQRVPRYKLLVCTISILPLHSAFSSLHSLKNLFEIPHPQFTNISMTPLTALCPKSPPWPVI